jgi:hypothetical protein
MNADFIAGYVWGCVAALFTLWILVRIDRALDRCDEQDAFPGGDRGPESTTG